MAIATINRISGYGYDADGNMTNDGLHTYTYDAENRLTTIDGGAERFVYDAAGMRVKKNATVYIYQGGHAIAEYANGALAASPTVEYVGRMASFSGGTTTYFYQDHLSNRFLANASGTVTGTVSQFPFGELTSGSASTKWAFTNYERDNAGGDSGLDYAYGRFYSSRLGRFMTMDPFSGSIGNPQSLNRYAYVQNDPINAIDPTGMLTGRLTCLLDDKGDCVGGNGYVPGGADGGDIFGVNDDPFGPWVDPTRSDPLAEGEARYANDLAQLRLDRWLAGGASGPLVTYGPHGELELYIQEVSKGEVHDPDATHKDAYFTQSVTGHWFILPAAKYVPVRTDLPVVQADNRNYFERLGSRINFWMLEHKRQLAMWGCILAPNGYAAGLQQMSQGNPQPTDESAGGGGGGAIWINTNRTNKNGGQTLAVNPAPAAVANVGALAADNVANAIYCANQ